MGERTRPWHPAVVTPGIITLSLLVAVFAAAHVPGYDASFTLAWGRDLANGLPLDFTHPSSPTPHPLALLVGFAAGFAPVHVGISAAGGVGVAAGLTTLTLLGYVTHELTASRIATGAAVLMAAASAALGLLVLGASSDVAYCAISLGAVLLTLRGRHTGAVALFMVAALLRPEAVLLALVPLVLSFTAQRRRTARETALRPAWVRTAWVFAVGLVLTIAAWLVMGAAGGDPLVALHSAATNAEVNDNPRGLVVALTDALPGLASPTGWLTVAAATVALIAAARARRASARKAQLARPSSHQRRTITPKDDTPLRATLTTGIFVGIGLVAYLAQGLTGTPLVARYLLLPALLCIALAARCITLIARRARTTRGYTVAEVTGSVVLVTAAAWANVTAWQDVTYARDVRINTFTSAIDLLDTDLARHCDAPFVVRSPAMVAVTALALDRPLRDIAVADQARDGVLLQPLTRDAADLVGYGPMTPLEQQAQFPTDAPPRQSNDDWALYSRCQP